MPPVTSSGIDPRRRCHGAAGLRDLQEAADRLRRENDYAARTPRATVGKRRVGERPDPSSLDVDGLQPSIREKSDRMAILRPEWCGGSIGTRKGFHSRTVESSEPSISVSSADELV